MKHGCQKWLTPTLIICSFALLLNGCTTISGTVHTEPDEQGGYRHPPVGKNGPPAHAPAHGYRAKHQYRYYPACSVYFDIGKKVYFYMEGGSWRISVTLPSNLRVRLGRYVVFEMDTDRPYLQHKKHKQKYPPGQLKPKKHKKWVRKK